MSLKTRIKTLFIALLGTASLWTGQATAAGTLPIAMAQQVDINGQPLAGCIVNFFVAGTPNSPQNSFSDFSLSLNPNNILTCDQAGRVPMFWLADGLVHVRMTDAAGSPIIDTTMQVLGPSSGGGGGGGTVDPTTIASTGDLKWRLDKATLSGWVRINGLTIGSATSGATERANADTQALFVYVWQTFSQPTGNVICPVVGGLGANALADFNANKQITLEDARARSIFALDDMGNSALGGFSGVAFQKGGPTIGGASAGINSTLLSLGVLPAGIQSSNPAQAISVTSAASLVAATGALLDFNPPGASGFRTPNNTASLAPQPSSGSNTINVTSTNTLGQPLPSVPSALLGTIFWKL